MTTTAPPVAPEDGPRRSIAVKIEPGRKAAVDEAAYQARLSTSQLVRAALLEVLDDPELLARVIARATAEAQP